jgi:hypothetical protein
MVEDFKTCCWSSGIDLVKLHFIVRRAMDHFLDLSKGCEILKISSYFIGWRIEKPQIKMKL